MDTRLLPGTSLRVSVVGMGCWALGKEGWGDDVDDGSSRDALAAALDAGVTLFDTAPIYGRGHADEVLRAALGPRLREVVVATKAGPRHEGGRVVCDLSPANLRRDVEESLARLGLETLPLVQLHWPCEVGTPLEASLEALSRMVDEGKIICMGLCNYGADDLRRARACAPVAALQTPLSLFRRELEGPLSEAARALSIGILAYEPLARGLLAGRYARLPRFPETDLRRGDPRFWAARFAQLAPRVERLRALSARLGTTPAALAIAWAASRPGVSAVLAGAKRRAQVEENVRAAELLARPGAQAVLDAVGRAV